MAYEWFNSSPIYDPLSSFTPSVAATPLTSPYVTPYTDVNAANTAARAATEAWASPFSTAFGGTAPSTTLDYVRGYASPFSDVFGGTAPATPYSPSQMTPPVVTDTVTDKKPKPDGGGGPPPPPPAPANLYTDQIWILIAKLKAAGIPASTADRSGAFFQSVLGDGITDLDNAVDIFLYSKTYKAKNGQDIVSPYYQDFGKFNDKLTSAKPPGVMVPWVLGIKDTVSKYDTTGSLSLYATDESIQKYLQNDIKVSDLDTRLNTARLKAITSDTAYTDALIQLGFIGKPSDLTGFFASPDLGQKQLEQNASTGAFAAEAIRRAKVGGIQADLGFAKQETADLLSQGYNEAQIAAISEKNYSTIARNIMPETKLSGIYQGKNAATAGTIQSELQQQEFNSIDSERAKILANQEIGAFSGSAGLAGSSAYLRKTALNKESVGQQ